MSPSLAHYPLSHLLLFLLRWATLSLRRLMWSRKWTFLQQPSWLLLAIALCLYTKKVSFRVLGCHNLVKLYSKQLAEAARQLLSCYYIMHGKLSFSSLAFTCLEKKLLSQVGLLSWQLGLRRFLRLSFWTKAGGVAIMTSIVLSTSNG